MNENKTVAIQESAKEKTNPVKRQYASPRLDEYGCLAHLTKGQQLGNSLDGVGGNKYDKG